ncbi:MAG TPA: hypothetical protein PK643_03350 [Saprospiraceae bacterium]|nr:hypothetical protein [Saprospiraceae bacterium]
MSEGRKRASALTRIREFYEDKWDEVELTEKQETIRTRLSAAFSMLCKFNSPVQCVPYLMKEFDISEVQAYRDIKDATKLFGNVLKSDKEGHRYIIYEYAIKTYQMAADKGDHKAMAASVANMIKLLGLDRDDPDLPDFAKLQPNVYPILIPESLEAKLDKLIEAPGPINLSKFLNKDAAEAVIIDDNGGKTGTDTEGNRQPSRKRER